MCRFRPFVSDWLLTGSGIFGSDRITRTRRGFTIVELIVVMIAVGVLLNFLLPAVTRRGGCSASLKDKTQIQQIHKAALVFAAQAKGALPMPSMIQSGALQLLADDGVLPREMRSDNMSLNHTALLYSAMIAQIFFKPELCVGPTEVNPGISVKSDYDYNAYQPLRGEFWDSAFTGDPSSLSNVSYSHVALCGQRVARLWRDNQDPGAPVFGTRGTGGGPHFLGGALTGPEYDRSPTLHLHGPKDHWTGHVAFGDNHCETLDTFRTPFCKYLPATGKRFEQDNMFAAEFDDAPDGKPMSCGDAWLGMFSATSHDGQSCTPRWDALNSK